MTAFRKMHGLGNDFGSLNIYDPSVRPDIGYAIYFGLPSSALK